MCRLFAYVGREAALLEDVLIVPKHAITKQIHDHFLPGLVETSLRAEPQEDRLQAKKEADLRNKLFNIDGFGVAYYTNTAQEYNEAIGWAMPTLYKTVAPALTDPTFGYLCGNTDSLCVFAHVRATSSSAVVEVNNHPFAFGRHIFAHNGEISNIKIIRRRLAEEVAQKYYNQIEGTTDSEHMAALYMTNLGDQDKAYTVQEMKTALLKTVKTVHALQDELVAGKDKEASSLNLAVSDGKKLVALRWRNSATEQPPSLYISTTAGVALNRKYPGTSNDTAEPHEAVHPKGAKDLNRTQNTSEQLPQHGHAAHVIVASEPTTFNKNQWRLIEKNHVVTVDEDMTIGVEEAVL